jgi:hypothetical protein
VIEPAAESAESAKEDAVEEVQVVDRQYASVEHEQADDLQGAVVVADAMVVTILPVVHWVEPVEKA